MVLIIKLALPTMVIGVKIIIFNKKYIYIVIKLLVTTQAEFISLLYVISLLLSIEISES